jgi:hypothetical protein
MVILMTIEPSTTILAKRFLPESIPITFLQYEDYKLFEEAIFASRSLLLEYVDIKMDVLIFGGIVDAPPIF